MRGPMGEIIYKGKGNFHIEGKHYKFDKVKLGCLCRKSHNRSNRS